jgi:hypothetical protein
MRGDEIEVFPIRESIDAFSTKMTLKGRRVGDSSFALKNRCRHGAEVSDWLPATPCSDRRLMWSAGNGADGED